jgi:hypothetical protein
MQNAHGPDFYPRPNKSVRVRTAGAGPSRALARPNPLAVQRTQQPVACSSRPPTGHRPAGSGWLLSTPFDEDLSMGTPQTQTPGATPRKVFRIPESRPRVNEKPARVARQPPGLSNAPLRPGGAGRPSRAGGNKELEPPGRPHPPHSSRSRISGLTDSARCAGIHVASSPSSAIARTTPPSTSGSRGVA